MFYVKVKNVIDLLVNSKLLPTGQYRCGPTSQIAVKNGHIHMPYDVPFVYAEVNADKLFWKYKGSSQPMKLLGKKTGGLVMEAEFMHRPNLHVISFSLSL